MIKTITEIPLPVMEKLCIRKQRIQNGTSSRRICIVTGVHGDELEGQYVCYLLEQKLAANLQLLDGIVDIYPAINPLGIDSITRGIPSFDLDMNRVFPGNTSGSMTEYAAGCIMGDLLGADLCIDIHASNIFLTEIPQVRINEQHKQRLLPLAQALNTDFIWVYANSTVLESTLAYSLNCRGTDTLVVEMGVGMRITIEYSKQLLAGILNILHEKGVYKGEVEAPRLPFIADSADAVAFLNAPAPGIFVKEKNHGTMLRAGELLGEIVDPLNGTLIERICAPCAGLLITLREYPVVNEGSLMGRILKQEYCGR